MTATVAQAGPAEASLAVAVRHAADPCRGRQQRDRSAAVEGNRSLAGGHDQPEGIEEYSDTTLPCRLLLSGLRPPSCELVRQAQ